MPTSPYVSRINQIDAVQLDKEIYKVFKNQTKEIAKYLPPGKIDKWQPEIDAVLQILLWNFSLKTTNSTFGQQLLNLHYPKISKLKSIFYLILSVTPTYIQEKLLSKRVSINDSNSFAALKALIERITVFLNLIEIVNLMTFLHRGTQPSIVERILGISSQSLTSHKPRNIGYSYMTRELVWHGLIELFTIGLPLINFHYLKHLMRNFWTKKKYVMRKTFPIMNLHTECCYCTETPILPTHAGCEHIFCYYCLQANFMVISKFKCPGCDTELFAENLTFYTAPKAIVRRDLHQLR